MKAKQKKDDDISIERPFQGEYNGVIRKILVVTVNAGSGEMCVAPFFTFTHDLRSAISTKIWTRLLINLTTDENCMVKSFHWSFNWKNKNEEFLETHEQSLMNILQSFFKLCGLAILLASRTTCATKKAESCHLTILSRFFDKYDYSRFRAP